MKSIPGGWVNCAIADLGEVRGGRQRSPHFSAGIERPYLRVANVLDDRIDCEDVLNMPFTDNEYRVYRLIPGDILLNEGQSLELVGRSAVYQGAPADCCFQNTLIRFRPNDGTDPQYANSLFRHLRVTGRFMAIAVRTTSIAHLGTARFAAMRVVCPHSKWEQHAIGSAIATWDTALARVEQLVDARERYRHGLAEALLTGKQRFKGFYATPWREFDFGDLFSERVEVGRADLPLLSISADRGIVPRDEMMRRDTSSDDKSKYLRIAPGDLGYNTMRMWQGVSALSQLEGIVSPAYTVCIPGERIHGPFAAHLFKLPRIVDRFRRHSQGLVDDTLNLKFRHFAQITVSIPCIEEQRAIAALLDALDKELAILKQLRDALDRQRRGVAELLLTGKVRVPA